VRNWLKESRDLHHFTQEHVAKKCDISRSFYTQIESGVKTPSVAVAKRIAQTLEVDWTLFFDSDSHLKRHCSA
jgi:putative transcriptional regulator